MRPERSRVHVMMPRCAALASRAYCEGAIRPCSSTVRSAHMGGATIFTPCAASARSSARVGSSLGTFASSRNTAWFPKSGSWEIQYRMSFRLKDCANTSEGGIPASLYSSIMACAYASWLPNTASTCSAGRSRTPEAAAEVCFWSAIESARRQGAKSWELRAATSLSRLRQQQGRVKEAREALADIYGWFSEGFDTPDLRAAKSLVTELS